MTPTAQAALREIRAEITRINKAAGETVFNPAATQMLEDLIEQVEEGPIDPPPGIMTAHPEVEF